VINLRNLNASYLLGASAFCYFALYLVLPNGSAAYPFALVAIGLAARWLFSRSDLKLGKDGFYWASALIAFALVGLASIAYHEASVDLVDKPLHFLVVGLLALTVLRYRLNVLWVQVGVFFGTLSILWLLISQYTGGRFAPTMNATKFGLSIALQAALCFSLAINCQNGWGRAVFVGLGLLNIYFVLLTGTRGAILAMGIYGVVVLGYLFVKSVSIRAKVVAFSVLVIAVVGSSMSASVQSRLQTTFSEISRIQSGDYNGSVGYRLVMYEAGLQAGLAAPVFGAGYDYAGVFESYSSSNQSKIDAAEKISGNFQNFHNLYVDTFTKRGLVGLVVLFAVFITALNSTSSKQFLLMVPPVVIIATGGLTDSVFELGITTSYFVIATTLLKCVDISNSQWQAQSKTI